MHPTTFLQKLLAGDRVQWKPLGDYSNYEQPTKYLVKSQSYNDDFKTPVLTAGKTFILGYTNETKGIYRASENPVIIFDDFTTANKWVDFDFKVKSSAMKMITSKDESKVLLKYIFYWLNKVPSGLIDSDHRRQWVSNYSNKKIPIPCPENREKSLAIQGEIVRILDAFTEGTHQLTAALQSEQIARQKQYEYYRNQLLTFAPEEVQWRTLGEVAEYSKTRIGFEQLDETNYVGVDNLLQNRAGKIESNYVPKSGKLTEYREGDILIGNIRPYLKKIWHADCVGGTNGDVLVIQITDQMVNPRYLYQILADEKFFVYNMRHAKGAKMPRGNKPKILEYPLPIPYPTNPEKSLEAQGRIVAILDQFEALTHSMSKGLPREIALRQKQYAYYRDLLLDFPQDEKV